MLLSIHLIVSLILAAILFPFFGFNSLFILIGNFLIDLDHPLFFLIKFRSFKFKKAYDYFRNIGLKEDIKELKGAVLVFHSIEFVVLTVILSFYYKAFLILSMGVILHIIMDMLYLYPIFKIISIKHLSLIWQIKNAKKQKE